MKIPENAPQWLKDATISEDAVFEIRLEFGVQIVDWKSGCWFKGIFNSGYFRGGYFRGGYFRGGYFLGGYFLGGEFRGGYFRGGEFRGGEFRGGYFLGGEFRGGEFRGGEFRGGYFRGGEFLGGVMCIYSKWFVGLTFEGTVKIGCKIKTFKEWDAWFKGKEEYSTKRNTPEFKRIYAHYVAIKAYKKEMDKK
jgi:uncharacterized protein YjbI with pentapeptide repeats